MAHFTVFISCLFSLLVSDVTVSDIIQLIRSGKLAEASEAISSISDKSDQNGNFLFCMALLEPDADSSASLFQEVVNSDADDENKQEASFRLAQYALVKNDLARILTLVTDYKTQWPDGVFESEMSRLEVHVQELSGDNELALGLIDQYLKKFTRDEPLQWGLIDKARIMIALNKKTGAMRILQRLTQESGGIGVPQALYLGAMCSFQKKDFDESSRQYSLLFEEYPLAVGLLSIEDQIVALPIAGQTDTNPGVVTRDVAPVVYVVKVGVFSVLGNAQTVIDQFKKKNILAEAVTRERDNKTLYIVYAGHFSTRQAAEQFRDSLQTANGERYEVIMR